MKRIVLGIVLAALAFSGGGVTPVEHDTEAGEVACAGQRRSNGKCDLVWLNYSVESRNGDQSRVNCPRGTSTSPECYRSYAHTAEASAGWGTDATEELVPPVGPFGGVRYGTGDADVRVWTGVNAEGGGSGSVAVAGGRNGSDDPFACATFYGSDDTEGHQISAALNDAMISDDRGDFDSDAQLCGEFLRGVL